MKSISSLTSLEEPFELEKLPSLSGIGWTRVVDTGMDHCSKEGRPFRPSNGRQYAPSVFKIRKLILAEFGINKAQYVCDFEGLLICFTGLKTF